MKSGEWRCKFVSARLNNTVGELGLEEALLFFFMGILVDGGFEVEQFFGKQSSFRAVFKEKLLYECACYIRRFYQCRAVRAVFWK